MNEQKQAIIHIAQEHFFLVFYEDHSAIMTGYMFPDGENEPLNVEHVFHFAPHSAYALLQKKMRDNHARKDIRA